MGAYSVLTLMPVSRMAVGGAWRTMATVDRCVGRLLLIAAEFLITVDKELLTAFGPYGFGSLEQIAPRNPKRR